MKLHIAKEGDSIAALSEKYQIEPEQIVAANPQLAGGQTITRGMKVKIPSQAIAMRNEAPSGPPSTPAAQQTAVEPPVAQPTTNATAAEPAVAQPTAVQPQFSLPMPPQAMPNQLPAVPSPLPNVTLPAMGMNPAPPMNANPYVSPTANTQPAYSPTANTQPSYYKTEPAASNLSPLNVKWSGMHDEGQAVNPYMPLPVPTVPAGMPSVPSAFPFGGMPYGYMQSPAQVPMTPYGTLPEPYLPVFPAGYQQASGDCGCGGHSAARLPYALPLMTAADEAASRKAQEVAIMGGAAGSAETAQAPGEKRARKEKKQVRIASSTEKLRKFVKRQSAKTKPAPSRSRPWMND